MSAVTVCVFIFEQLIQCRYGLVGAIAFGLLTFGLRARLHTLTCVGLVAVALLLAQ
ncbi:hypothetical protein [Actinacidiphila oryziradicis]|jgi:hypothetical protein|uniref:hypothetical protein n=1 Tax=Actinacidiphila oryziradicis TaxID=2571141 RepID=UPI00145E51A7|nr:hypothetical protein [Actinacidiphila oryziradicis]MCW2873584.1 hypothetical protein [Actinacidiphila oryziradicis]